MAMTQVTALTRSDVDQLNQIIQHLQGASGKADAYIFRSSSGNNFTVVLSDNVGARTFRILDLAENVVASIDSDGNMTLAGGLTQGTLLVPTAASPSQTTEGELKWDSDDDRLTAGTGAATKVIGLSRGAGLSASATQELAYDTTSKLLNVWDGSASRTINTVQNYKTATQVITTTTTFADVTGALGATFSFPIAANEVWEAEYYIPLAFGGTGGAKFQLTGPGTPTNVDSTGEYTVLSGASTTDNTSIPAVKGFAAVTAFSSAIAAANSASGALWTNAGAYERGSANFVRIRARVINGANAGTVTLQAAQNSSNSTTTLGLGSYMRAERIA